MYSQIQIGIFKYLKELDDSSLEPLSGLTRFTINKNFRVKTENRPPVFLNRLIYYTYKLEKTFRELYKMKDNL